MSVPVEGPRYAFPSSQAARAQAPVGRCAASHESTGDLAETALTPLLLEISL